MGIIGGELGYRLLRGIASAPRQGQMDGSAFAGKSKLEVLLGRDMLARTTGKSVLDFGCGEGAQAVELAERGLLSGVDRREIVAQLNPQMESSELLALQKRAREVFVSPALLDYVQAILRHTRESAHYVHGLSPRAGLALLSAARAWALLDERDAVIPEDVQTVLPGVTSHRLQAVSEYSKQNGDVLMRELIEAVAIP